MRALKGGKVILQIADEMPKFGQADFGHFIDRNDVTPGRRPPLCR